MYDLTITNVDLLANSNNHKCFQNIQRTFHEFLFQKYSDKHKNMFMKSRSSKNCFVGYPVEFLILEHY